MSEPVSSGSSVLSSGGSILRRLRLAEEQVEAVAERALFVLALGERQQKGVAQDAAVGKADAGYRAHRIDAFGGRDPDPGPARRTKEAMQVLAHPLTRRRFAAKPWQ